MKQIVQTDFGTFEVEGSSQGVTRVRLIHSPGRSKSDTQCPNWLITAADKIKRHLQGEPQDFSDVKLDMSQAPPFFQKVYARARKIRSGQTLTYGELANSVQCPGGARAVGQAMRRNPTPIIIPCHRVIGSNGKMGGFSLGSGVALKRRLLELENSHLD